MIELIVAEVLLSTLVTVGGGASVIGIIKFEQARNQLEARREQARQDNGYEYECVASMISTSQSSGVLVNLADIKDFMPTHHTQSPAYAELPDIHRRDMRELYPWARSFAEARAYHASPWDEDRVDPIRSQLAHMPLPQYLPARVYTQYFKRQNSQQNMPNPYQALNTLLTNQTNQTQFGGTHNAAWGPPLNSEDRDQDPDGWT